MTRQALSAHRRKALGYCPRCGKKRDGKSEWLCNRCLLKVRVHNRIRNGNQSQTVSGMGRPAFKINTKR